MEGYKPKIETKKEKPSQIILHFMRHSIKEKGYEDDYKAPLSEEGVNLSLAESQRYKSSVPAERQRAYGSPRLRSRETAQIVMNQSEKDFDQIIRSDERLNYKTNLKTGTELAEEINRSFLDKDYLKTLVEKSDELAEKTNDSENTTYGYSAKNIASFVNRHVNLADRWDKRAREHHDKEYDPRVERFIGTHQGIVEAFVAKVLEIQSGIEKRDEFVKMLGNNGFEFIEGVDITIETTRAGTEIRLVSNGYTPEFQLNEVIEQETLNTILENQSDSSVSSQI